MFDNKIIMKNKFAYSLAEISVLTSLSKSHLRNENKRGKLRFLKSGRRTLVTYAELARYLAGLENNLKN